MDDSSPGRGDKTTTEKINSRQTFVYKASLSLENGHLFSQAVKSFRHNIMQRS